MSETCIIVEAIRVVEYAKLSLQTKLHAS